MRGPLYPLRKRENVMVRATFLTTLLVAILVVKVTAAPVPPVVPTKLYQARLDAARKVFKVTFADLRVGMVDADTAYLWSRRWLEAERPLCKTQAERIAACTAHLKRLEELRKIVVARYKVGKASASEATAFEFYVAEARVWEAEAKAR
jgi:hypothetical protein